MSELAQIKAEISELKTLRSRAGFVRQVQINHEIQALQKRKAQLTNGVTGVDLVAKLLGAVLGFVALVWVVTGVVGG
jgi:hypothetical protein